MERQGLNGSRSQGQSAHSWRRRMVLAAVSALAFFLGCELGGFQFALLKIADEFALGGRLMGALVGVQYGAIMVMPLVFGRVADRFGKKRVLLAFLSILLMGCLLAALSRSVETFILGVFVIGTGYSVCECSMTAAIADSFPNRSEQSINLSQSMFSLGAVAAPLVMELITERFGADWRAAFWICAVGFALVLPLMALADVGTPPVRSAQGMRRCKKRNPAATRLLLALVVSTLLYTGIENGVAYFVDALFSLELAAPRLGAYAISLFWLSISAARLVFSRFKRMPRLAVPAAMGIGMLSFLGIVFCKQAGAVLALLAVAGASCGCVWPGIMDTALSNFPEASGRVSGYLMAGAGLGGAATPVLMGLIGSAAGMSHAFALIAALALLTGALMLWAKRRRPAGREAPPQAGAI